jgi:hypothetical protein
MSISEKKEQGLRIIFLHFANMTRVIKDRNYISRNGKFPGFTDRDISNKGYQFSYLITLRKFLEGHLGKKEIKLEKRKDYLQYGITPKEREYAFGSNPFLDEQIKLKLFNERGLLGVLPQFSGEGFQNDNHSIKFDYPLAMQRSGRPSRLNATYKFNLSSRNQIYADQFFSSFEEYTQEKLFESGLRTNEKEILRLEVGSVFEALETASLLRRAYLTQKKVAKRKALTRTENRVESRLDRLATKYSLTADELREFIEGWQRLINDSEGVSENQLFEFQKNIVSSGNRGYSRLEYNDFESAA